MNVPKLRFKGFSDNWAQTTLGEVSRNVMYGMNVAAMAFDGMNKYIRITDIDDETRTYLPAPLTSPSGEIESKFKLKNGDIVFARTGASVGKAYLYNQKDGNVFFAGFLVKFSVIGSNPYFVFSQTMTESYESWVKIMSMRSGQPGINAEEYKEFRFFVPQIEEQTKIANFLTAIDEKISQLTQKCDLLKQYKKGIMQQIFSQKLRFKNDDGEQYLDWQASSILELSESGFTNGVFNDPTKVGSGYKLINVIDMYIEATIDETRLSLVELSESEFERNKVKDGDIFFTRSSLVKEGIACSNVYLGHSQNVTFDGHLIRMSPRKDLINPNFFNYVLRTPKIRRQLVMRGKTATMTTIGQADIATVNVAFPSFPEQTKIANFLTTIDDKITHTQTQLDAVKQYKKGLLQQMFV